LRGLKFVTPVETSGRPSPSDELLLIERLLESLILDTSVDLEKVIEISNQLRQNGRIRAYTPFIDTNWDRVVEVSLTGSANLREDVGAVRFDAKVQYLLLETLKNS